MGEDCCGEIFTQNCLSESHSLILTCFCFSGKLFTLDELFKKFSVSNANNNNNRNNINDNSDNVNLNNNAESNVNPGQASANQVHFSRARHPRSSLKLKPIGCLTKERLPYLGHVQTSRCFFFISLNVVFPELSSG